MERGKKYIMPIFGILVEGEKLKELLQDEKENRDNEESKLFQLHEDWSGLDGWFIGKEKDPEGMVVGTCLYMYDHVSHEFGSHMSMENPLFDFEKMQPYINKTEEHAASFGYEHAIRKFLGKEYHGKEMKWYMAYMEWETG